MDQSVTEAVIKLQLEPLENGGYVATSLDVPGLVAERRTIAETVEIARDVIRMITQSCLEHGDPLPPALSRHAAAPESLELQVVVPTA
jgi:antitoxin HicB